MIPEIKQEWVAELRSSKYRQHTGNMFAGGTSYCPLGVLCSIFAKYHKGKTRWKKYDHKVYNFECDNGLNKWMNGGSTILPPVVASWAQLQSENPTFAYGREELSISEANDMGKSFRQIADMIEYGEEV
jgi:hypothetical protein